MHVLGSIGHSFSQRRKSHKPKELHIRKVSFSGCSLSSGCSFSSTSSTFTARAPSSVLRTPTSSHSFGPLSSNPTFQPLPRLHDRPLISPDRNQYPQTSGFFDDDNADEEDYICRGNGEEYTVCREKKINFRQPTEMTLPPHTILMDHDEENTEAHDYFMVQLANRPPMPRSRWSDSTIQTLDLEQMTPVESTADSYNAETLDTEADVPLEIPNFSYKRDISPRRPHVQSLGSLEGMCSCSAENPETSGSSYRMSSSS